MHTVTKNKYIVWAGFKYKPTDHVVNTVKKKKKSIIGKKTCNRRAARLTFGKIAKELGFVSSTSVSLWWPFYPLATASQGPSVNMELAGSLERRGRDRRMA